MSAPPRSVIPDRDAFVETVGHALLRAPRSRRVAVLAIVVDADAASPTERDEVMAQVSDRLQHEIRKQDALARLDDDEFAVLLNGLRRPEDAQHTAARIAHAVRRPVRVGGDPVQVGCHVGVSLVGAAPPETAARHMLGQAGMAMYLARRQGAGRVVVFDSAAREPLIAVAPGEEDRLQA